MLSRRFALGVVLACSWFVPSAHAQAPQAPAAMAMMDHRGAVSGTIRDGAGAAVADAAVTATNVDTGAQFTATSDAQGGYSFAALPVGKYDITVQSAGLTTFRQRGVDVADGGKAQVNIALTAATAAEAAQADRDELLGRIASLEQRITDLESSAVLSEPETRVRRVEVYVDENGNQLDEPAPGATPTVTYQRERVYRRQTISEKLEEALEDAENRRIGVGVDAAIATQTARRTDGPQDPGHSAYALASADLFFTAGLAQYTVFFADIVMLSGSPPDAEIPSLTLLNGYTARLVAQNQLNLREVWMRTELFGQRLALTAGRLDLTSFFDQNAFANDESVQFISDALVNNQMLGLSSNGTGFATEYDPKNGFRFKFGLQQSNDDAINLSDSLFTLTEAGYTFTPFALPEGAYRFWFRTDNAADDAIQKAWGISADQKLTNVFGVFGRYGAQQTDLADEHDHFYSAGVSFQNGLVFTPLDTWGVGYANMDLVSGDKEDLVEGYYNFHLTERLRLSFHLTGVLDKQPDSESKFGYLLPGVRFQAAF